MSYISDIKSRTIARQSGLGKYDCGKLGRFIWMFAHPITVRKDIGFSISTMPKEEFKSSIEYALSYVVKRENCAGIVALQLLHLLHSSEEIIFENLEYGELKSEIRDAIIGLKYWITDKGEDSMCTFSEGHQAVFATVELLASELYPDAYFADIMIAECHRTRAKKRLLNWCKSRLKYGFSEFASAESYSNNMAAFATYMHFGEDEELKSYVQKVMDVMLYDCALLAFDGNFAGAQGNAEVADLTFAYSADASIATIINYALSKEEPSPFYRFDNIGILIISAIEGGAYVVPQVFKNIYNATGFSVRTSAGLGLKEMERLCLTASDEDALAYHFGAGAVTNPEVIESTMRLVAANDLWHYPVFNKLKYLDLKFMYRRRRFRAFAECNKLFSQGSVKERYNIYSYRTPFYQMSTLMKYRVGLSGGQVSTMGVTLLGGASVYTMHPACEENYECAPGYFAGYGVAPDAVQDDNIVMMIHRIPHMYKGAPKLLPYTHTFLPRERLDVAVIDGRYVFFKKGNAFGAIIGASDFIYKPYDKRISDATDGNFVKPMEYDLVQKGRNQFTIYEMSSAAKESFGNFVTRIKLNKLKFNGKKLVYISNDKIYVNTYKGSFTVGGDSICCEFPRYDSAFGYTERADGTIKVLDYKVELE